MFINFDKALGSHEQALYLQSRRAGVLASNLANADTPNYKARDLDFRTALQQAGHSVRLAATNPNHLQARGSNMPGGELQYRVPSHSSLDGNTVDVDAEQASFAENALRYQASLRFLSGRFRGMKNAMKEQ